MDPEGDGRRRRPRLEDVAAAVGVSTASVSLVLRNAPGPSAETRRRVLEAASRLGYRPDRTASLLARRRSRLIGIMLDIRSRFHAEMVEDIHEVAERHGYDLVLSAATRSRSEQRAVETLIDSRCEALVLLGPELPTARLAELDRQLPVVVVGRRLPSATVDVVRVPDDEGVARAVAHLVELGHREIVYVDGGPGSIGADRRRGYQQAMRTHRLRDTARVVPGGRTEEAGSAAARELLDGAALPTAIVAFNDRCAVGLLDVLARNGVDVPGEVSVVGYDDDPLARMRHVSLTSVGQDSAALTERALEAVVERLDGGRTGHREVVIAPYLAVRATTGPVRPAGSA